jgi:hypothetical protein
VLRVDSVAADGTKTRRFDTESVNYPPSLPSSTFELSGGTFTSSHEAIPVPVKNLTEARTKAGFVPLAPHALPFGFVVRKAYIRVAENYKTIGFNISDGLTAATVFEFSSKACSPSVRQEMKMRLNDFFQSGDTIVGIVSDLDPKIRAKLLKAFKPGHPTSLREAEEPFNNFIEPFKSARAGTALRSFDVAILGSRWRKQSPLG